MAEENELIDYEEESENEGENEQGGNNDTTAGAKKGHYAGIHVSGFKDFILKPECLRAVTECAFEHPSEVQHECIPHALLGMDVICQAKAGMGKTAVFVLATLHQIQPAENTACIVLCHTKELAFQIAKVYERLGKYLPEIKVAVFFGGKPVKQDIARLKEPAHVVVGTPGRIRHLVNDKHLDLSHVKHFVLDECDRMLQEVDMRKQVQEIFMQTPHDKQVMMFSATLPTDIRPIARKFCQDPMEIFVDNEKLTLHGLQQHYIKLHEQEKNRKLNDLLDALEFNQVVIFVSKVARANALGELLKECMFPTEVIHGGLSTEERLKRYQEFKDFKKRILVATDLFGRGIDIERVNIVINYDFPESRNEHDNSSPADQYLHRVGRAGRFGTKGLSISFISTEDNAAVLAEVQSKFEVDIKELPDNIDISTYM